MANEVVVTGMGIVSSIGNNIKEVKKSLTNFMNFNSNETIKQCFKISIVYLILTIIILRIGINYQNIYLMKRFN